MKWNKEAVWKNRNDGDHIQNHDPDIDIQVFANLKKLVI